MSRRSAFLGFYIVKPELRGQGHGLRLWQAGMARLDDRVVGLDGVIAQQENYKNRASCSPTATSASAVLPIANRRATRRIVAIDAEPAWTPSWPMTVRSFPPRATRSCDAGCGPSGAREWR